MPPPSRPIFFNESGRRARITNALLLLISFSAVLVLAGLIYGTVVVPTLPEFEKPPSITQAEPYPGAPPGRIASAERLDASRNRHLPPEAAGVMRLAFVPGTEGSFEIVKQRFAELDGVIPDWLEIKQSDGRVRVQVNPDSPHGTRWLKETAPGLRIFPLMNSGLTKHETSVAFALRGAREKIYADVVSFLERYDLGGLVFQLPDATGFNERHVLGFVRDLKTRVNAQGRKLIVMTSLTDGRGRIAEFAKAADFILVTTHDNVQVGKPGPIAAQGWFEAELSGLFARVDPARIIVGIGSLAVDWDHLGRMKQMSVPAAWTAMQNAGSQMKFDASSLNPTFRYLDENKQRHEVWLLDAVTTFNQLRAALPHKPAGVALSALGSEDAAVWGVLGRGKRPDTEGLARLTMLQPGRDLFAGLGKVALVSATPGTPGKRALAYNERIGLIVAETIEDVPRQAQVTSWWPIDKTAVALTFDDGPDPTYTPKVLDILREKGAKATFYVIGRNAVLNPGILQRIYDEGHDVGNHTFSHSRLMGSGRERILVELNAAQRVIEAQTGARTRLFRPPEAFSGLSFLDASPLLVEVATELGYQIGALDTDSYDWVAAGFGVARPSGIVERVVRKISDGDGQIVLLHDSGGNRQVTIDALPDLIDQLRARGFRLVTTHELVGQPRDAIMPPTRAPDLTETVSAEVWRLGSHSFSWVGDALPLVAVGSTVMALCRLTIIILGATVHRLRERRPQVPAGWEHGGVTVLVPAYNEEVCIGKTISTLLASTIADRFDILVIDDGSTDGTADLIRREFADHPNVRVITKANGGKAAALNFGLQQTRAEIVVAIDGDTVLLPDAVERLIAHFHDPRIGAVAGTVSVGNRKTLIACFQALEYTMSQNLDRRAFQLINAIGVVPGAIGAWRREAVLAVGGYSHDTLAEDADLTISLELAGWKVVCEPTARALTEVPERLRPFLKQRFRWMFGTLQVAYKHAPATFRTPRGISFVLLPNVILFQFLFTLVAPLMDAILLFTVASCFLDMWFIGERSSGEETLLLLAMYWAVFQVFDFLSGGAALLLHGRSAEWRLLPLLVLHRFCYRQLLYLTAARSLLAAVKGTFVGWGKLVRTGTVSLPVVSPRSLQGRI